MEVSESPTNANKELVGEIRSLTHEIKILTVTLPLLFITAYVYILSLKHNNKQ